MFLIFSFLVSGFWIKDSFPAPIPIIDITIGKARNDDTNRVYASVFFNGILEFTYRNSIWTVETIPYLNTELEIGNIRGDDTIRLYGCATQTIYELTYRNGLWECDVIGTIIDPIQSYIYDLKIGPGRNDDTNRIYLGHWNTKLYELSFRNGNWVKDSILPSLGGVENIVIGPGRNDGINRVYLAAGANVLCELTYSLTGWQIENFAWVPGTYTGIALGSGRNDNVNRIYSWSVTEPQGYNLYEWTGPLWTGVILGEGRGNGAEVCVSSRGNEDSLKVYGFTGPNVYEFSYNTNWQQFSIDSVAAGNYTLNVGSGRNDSLQRVYVGCGNGYIYEYTWVEEKIDEADKDNSLVHLTIYPNPFIHQAKINLGVPPQIDAILKFFDAQGQLIKKLAPPNPREGKYIILWPTEDCGLSAGVYFCVLEYGDKIFCSKMVKVK